MLHKNRSVGSENRTPKGCRNKTDQGKGASRKSAHTKCALQVTKDSSAKGQELPATRNAQVVVGVIVVVVDEDAGGAETPNNERISVLILV